MSTWFQRWASPGHSARAETYRGSPAGADSANASQHRQVAQLAEQVDQLTLVCWAMWSLICEDTNLTEKDLMNRVEQLDAADGRADGKVSRQVIKCSNCGRSLSQRHQHCLYCGHERPTGSAFERLT